MSSLTGSTDCYWDSWCDIRKFEGDLTPNPQTTIVKEA